MGQHKFNQTAIDAKEGKIPPKQKSTLSKRELRRMITEEFIKTNPVAASLMMELSQHPYS